MKVRGFTLVELLVVLAILSLLAGLLFPAIQAARTAARDSVCRSNLHQFGVEMHDRELRDERIPPLNQGSPRLSCPEYLLGDGLDYFQFFTGERRPSLVERFQLPSENIAVIADLYDVHRGRKLALFLDGHVDYISPVDAGIRLSGQ